MGSSPVDALGRSQGSGRLSSFFRHPDSAYMIFCNRYPIQASSNPNQQTQSAHSAEIVARNAKSFEVAPENWTGS